MQRGTDDSAGTTPQREMHVVLDRIKQLEVDYGRAVSARNARLAEQHDRFTDLQTAVQSNARKHRSEVHRLRAALRLSESKQAALAGRLSQLLHANKQDETSHLQQLMRMHGEQMVTMQEGMRELLRTLGVDDTVIGNLDALCGVGADAITQSSAPAEQARYNMRRQSCELAIALRKAISVVREKLDVEESARADADQRASDFLDAAHVVDQALQKAGAVLLREERALGPMPRQLEAVSVPGTAVVTTQSQWQSQRGGSAVSAGPGAPQLPSHSSSIIAAGAAGAGNMTGRGSAHYPMQPPPPTPDNGRLGADTHGNSSPAPRREQQQQQHAQNYHNSSSSSSGIGGGAAASSASIATAFAVLKDIVFGSLDVVKDMQKIMTESRSELAGAFCDSAGNVIAMSGNNTGVSAATSASSSSSSALAASPPRFVSVQVAVDRARTAERAIAGQALLELRREIEAHQHSRATLQGRVALLTTQYDRLLQGVAVAVAPRVPSYGGAVSTSSSAAAFVAGDETHSEDGESLGATAATDNSSNLRFPLPYYGSAGAGGGDVDDGTTSRSESAVSGVSAGVPPRSSIHELLDRVRPTGAPVVAVPQRNTASASSNESAAVVAANAAAPAAAVPQKRLSRDSSPSPSIP